MSTLMIARAEAEAATDRTVFGGRPSAPGGALEWPVCATCDGPMQFLGQLRLEQPDRLALVFMCQNDPGMCDEWEAFGGNAVVVVDPSSPALVTPPATGETTRPERYGVDLRTTGLDDAAAPAAGDRPAGVMGQWAGEPAWIQDEETPDCPDCDRPMAFVAQLEEGPDFRTGMNFGGGEAYVFRCAGCDTAAFLWQQ